MAVIFDTPVQGGGVRFDDPTFTSGPAFTLFIVLRILAERRKQMSTLLRQNTAAQARWIGPFYSTADGSLLTAGAPTVTVSKAGAAWAAIAGTVGAIQANGRALVTFALGDVDTLKTLELQATVTGGFAVPMEFTVVSQPVYDQTFGTTAAPTVAEIADAVHDEVVDGTLTLRESQRLQNSIAGKASGAGTGTEVFRNPGDTKNRIQATVDNSGNRTGIVYDLS